MPTSELLPNLRHLRTFQEACRQRSISRAADIVHLSQPAATQAIARLEEQLGCALLERVGTGVVPTAGGSAYVVRVERALRMIETGATEAGCLADHPPAHAHELLPRLTSTLLRAFLAVGGTGNFRLAAPLAGTSQPTLHRSARELEDVLGFALLEKTTRGTTLTAAGERFWQQVRLAFAELDQGLSELRATQGIEDGRILVGCLPLARHDLLPNAIAAFTARHPRVPIHVIESPYPALLQDLRRGEIDVLIGALRHPSPAPDVVQELLFSASLCIAAGPDHPLAGKSGVSLAELAAWPWVVPPHDTPTRERFEKLMAAHPEVAEHGLIESSSQILIRGLLRNSHRLTLISTQQVRLEIELGLLACIDHALGPTLREIGLATRSGWRPTVIQHDFLDCLRGAATALDTDAP